VEVVVMHADILEVRPRRGGARLDPGARMRAAAASSDVGSLLEAVEDPSPEVARAALRRLAAAGDPGVIERLHELIRRCDIAIAHELASALHELGDYELPGEALAMLEDGSYVRRLVALRTLSVTRDAIAADAVIPLLEDPIGGVRAAAAEALADLRPGAHSAYLCARLLGDPSADVRLLGDPSADVRRRAVAAVARCLPSIGPLLEAAVRDADPLVRQQAGLLASRVSVHGAGVAGRP
jgi:HEAT repeat protein